MALATEISTRPKTQEKPQQSELAEPWPTQVKRETTPWEQLRAPFPAEKIGKLPKATVDREKYKTLPKARCNECGGWHPATSTIHLDFIGHADVTDRLLQVDPHWNWEPLASDESGLPKFVVVNGRPVGLWIKLTISGVTRLGYGSCDPGKGDAEKELIGDALRNGAMRFGVALDLWRKERPHVEEEEEQRSGGNQRFATTKAPGPDAAAVNRVTEPATNVSKLTGPEIARLTSLNNSLRNPLPSVAFAAVLRDLPYDKGLAKMSAYHAAQCPEKPDCAHVRGGVA